MIAFIEHYHYLALFAILILGGIGLPFPEEATLMLAGFLLAHDIIKPVPGTIIILTGLLISDFFLYSIGKKYGKKILERPKFQHLLSPKRLSVLEEKFRRHGGLIILFGRHFFGLRAQLFLAAGISRLPPLQFVLFDALSATITMAVFIGIGYAGGNSFQIIKRDISRIEHVVLFVVVVALFLFLIINRIRERYRIKVESGVGD